MNKMFCCYGFYFQMFKQQRILLYCFTVLQRLGQKYEVCDGGRAAEVVEVHLDDPLTLTQVLSSGLQCTATRTLSLHVHCIESNYS